MSARCPHLRPGVAAISSQCHTNWRLGLIGLDLAGHGLSPTQIIEALRSYDPHFEYRQVGIVTADGAAAAHSPPKGADWTGHRVGDGYVAMGNGLAGPQVVDAIHDGFTVGGGVPFPERPPRAIEAGYAAGGEPIGQSSAGLMVGAASSPRLLVDIRIDMANPLPRDGGDAVRDLRRAYDAYAPLVDYYADFLARSSRRQVAGLRRPDDRRGPGRRRRPTSLLTAVDIGAARLILHPRRR